MRIDARVNHIEKQNANKKKMIASENLMIPFGWQIQAKINVYTFEITANLSSRSLLFE